MARRNLPMATRRAIADRYGARKAGDLVEVLCAYCGVVGSVYRHSWGWATFGAFEIDHVIPRARGGSDEPCNLTLACRPCNRRKRSDLWQPI